MANSRLLDEIIRHRVGLERYSTGVVRRILRHLQAVEADIEAQIRAALHAGVTAEATKLRRLDERLVAIRSIIGEATAAIRGDLTTELTDLAKAEVGWARRAYRPSVSVGRDFQTPSAQLLRSVVTSRPFGGRVLRDWVGRLGRETTDGVMAAVRIGIVEGESTDQIVRRLVGRNAGPAALDISRRSAELLVRTAVNHVSNRAQMAFIEENRDLFDRYQWISVLDSRTCFCAGTLIATPRGAQPIETLNRGDVVIGGSRQPRTINGTAKATTRRIAKVTLSNGKVLFCTPDHLFLTAEGWCPAEDLMIGQEFKVSL